MPMTQNQIRVIAKTLSTYFVSLYRLGGKKSNTFRDFNTLARFRRAAGGYAVFLTASLSDTSAMNSPLVGLSSRANTR